MHVFDKNVLRHLKQAPIEARLRVARLSHFARVVRHGPDLLRALIQEAARLKLPYAVQLQEDIADLLTLPQLNGLPASPQAYQHIESICKDHPAEWKGLLEKQLARASSSTDRNRTPWPSM